MKVFTMLFAALMLLAGCSQTPEEKAKAIITKAIKDDADDPSTYEPIDFGTLDSAITSLDDHKGYEALVDSLDDIRELMRIDADIVKRFRGIGDGISAYEDSKESIRVLYKQAEAISSRADSIEAAFKPEFVGWKMTHSFRLKQAGEDKKRLELIYYLDKDLTKVVPPPVVE